jgi:2-polyprenyl-6-methoxyphenol hydroxylase-like FAD-dependent oxidoreductase
MEDAIALAEALTQPLPDATTEPGALARFQHFAQTRGPAKDKLLGASRKSYLWYEDFGDWMRRYTPYGFIHAFMTRTGRLGEARLAQQYPELFAEFEREGLVQPQPTEDSRMDAAHAR